MDIPTFPGCWVKDFKDTRRVDTRVLWCLHCLRVSMPYTFLESTLINC